MKLTDPQKWEESKNLNTDDYGSAVMEYAERWANLMETELKKGSKLSDIAENTSHEADTDGITGFMYGCAVNILAKVWKYGEDLRRWHNLERQIGQEGVKVNETGGVLNPALLSIGK